MSPDPGGVAALVLILAMIAAMCLLAWALATIADWLAARDERLEMQRFELDRREAFMREERLP